MPRLTGVLFGTYDPSRNPRAAILGQGLSDLGFTVVDRTFKLELSAEERLTLFGGVMGAPRAAATLLGAALRALGRSLLTRRPAFVLVGYLAHLDILLARIRYPTAPLVMDHLVPLREAADDRGTGGPLQRRLVELPEALALAASDVVVVDTEEHRAAVPSRFRRKVVVCPVGALEESFIDPVPRTGDGALKVIFFGHYIPLQGTPTIGRALRLLEAQGASNVLVTMVGAGQDLEATRRLAGDCPSVTWIDTLVTRSELDALIRQHRVALGIFGGGPKAMRVVPTKVFEATAAGLGVITADTAPQRRALGDAALYVPAEDPVALADALQRLARDSAGVEALCRSARDLAVDSFRPRTVVKPLATALSDRLDRQVAASGPSTHLPPMTINAMHRWDVMEPQLVRQPPHHILEIGPGRGAMGARLCGFAEYTAVDTDAQARRDTRRAVAGHACPGTTPRVYGDWEAVASHGPYDLVVACEVLEHLEDDHTALDAWKQVMTPGGRLMSSVPAHPVRFGPWDAHVGHFRRYSRHDLVVKLVNAGYEIDSITPVGWPIGYALEVVWNMSARAMSERDTTSDSDMATRTASSSRNFQPGDRWGALRRLVASPGLALQRTQAATDRGIGWVAVARR